MPAVAHNAAICRTTGEEGGGCGFGAVERSSTAKAALNPLLWPRTHHRHARRARAEEYLRGAAAGKAPRTPWRHCHRCARARYKKVQEQGGGARRRRAHRQRQDRGDQGDAKATERSRCMHRQLQAATRRVGDGQVHPSQSSADREAAFRAGALGRRCCRDLHPQGHRLCAQLRCVELDTGAVSLSYTVDGPPTLTLPLRK